MHLSINNQLYCEDVKNFSYARTWIVSMSIHWILSKCGKGGGYLVEDFMGGGQMHVLGVLWLIKVNTRQTPMVMGTLNGNAWFIK